MKGVQIRGFGMKHFSLAFFVHIDNARQIRRGGALNSQISNKERGLGVLVQKTKVEVK